MGQRLGQHFLRDATVLADIVAAADLAPGQRVLEIGPGRGVLTEKLCAAVGPTGKVVAIEADAQLAAALRGRWNNLDLHVGDAVQTPLYSFGRFDRIVANLPYLISGPITVAFFELLRDPDTAWTRAILMYQAEFGARLLANAGNDAYGRLSVHAARWVRVEKVRDVAPGCFDPPPDVDSMVLCLEPHAQPPFEVVDENLWRAVVDGTFRERRKQLRNTLPRAVAGLGVSGAAAHEALSDMDLLTERPERVAPEEFAELVRLLAAA